MKLLITRDQKDQNDYVSIRTFDEFTELDESCFSQLECIRIDDCELGLSVIFWLRDHHPLVLRRTFISVNLASREDTADLVYFINKHRRAIARDIYNKRYGLRHYVTDKKGI